MPFGAIFLSDAALVHDGIYEITYKGSGPCKEMYLGYKRSSKAYPAPVLLEPASTKNPVQWKFRKVGTKGYSTLTAIDRASCCPAKLGYNHKCTSRTVSLAIRGNELTWKAVPVHKQPNVYRLYAQNHMQCGKFPRLGPVIDAATHKKCTGVQLFKVTDKGSNSMAWNFTLVKSPITPTEISPTPSPAPPNISPEPTPSPDPGNSPTPTPDPGPPNISPSPTQSPTQIPTASPVVQIEYAQFDSTFQIFSAKSCMSATDREEVVLGACTIQLDYLINIQGIPQSLVSCSGEASCFTTRRHLLVVPNFLVKTEVVVSTSASQSIHKHDIANAISELHSSLDAAGSTLINDFTLGTVLVVTTTEPTINIGSPTLIVQTYPLAAPYSRLITWPAIPNALSYNVRCTDQYSVAILKSAPQTSITITDLVVGSTYRCAVAVLTSTGVGAYSTPSDAFTVTKREVQVTLTTIFQVSSTKSCTEADIASMVQQACAIATNYVVTTQSIPAPLVSRTGSATCARTCRRLLSNTFQLTTTVLISSNNNIRIDETTIQQATQHLTSVMANPDDTIYQAFTTGTVQNVVTSPPTVTFVPAEEHVAIVVTTHPVADAVLSRLIIWTSDVGAISYELQCTSSNSGTTINTAVVATSYTLINLVSLTTYTCSVRATYASGVGEYSSPSAEFTVPVPPVVCFAISSPVAPAAVGVFYISTSGDNAHDGTTTITAVATLTQAISLVTAARTTAPGQYKIVFLAGTYVLPTSLTIATSDIEVTALSPSDVSSTILQLGAQQGLGISSSASNVWLHHLTLVQTADASGYPILLSTGAGPGSGEQILTDWSKNVYIYNNNIMMTKYGFAMAGENIQFVNNQVTRQAGTSTLSVVLVYFLRGSNAVSGNTVTENLTARIQLVRLAGAGTSGSTYLDLYQSRGGTLTVDGNTMSSSAANRDFQFYLQETFNNYASPGLVPPLFTADTKLALTFQCNIASINTPTDRLKALIFYGAADAQMYSAVNIKHNQANVPIDSRGWWFCDSGGPNCTPSFTALPVVLEGNVSP